ncbi:MAG: hypothetical protein WC661_21500 [Opitutaceae bacterium]|jgi:hypothetical protein
MTTPLPRYRLAAFRDLVMRQLAALADRDGVCGAYRMAPGHRTDLYSSIDAALMRTIMGEDLVQTVSAHDRRQWCEHINSFAAAYFHRPIDGSYDDRMGHSTFHANGQVIGALGVLGGKQKYPNRLYDGFDTPDKIARWLDTEIDWTVPWSESHRFWGGLHCFSFSRRCTPEWLTTTIDWLDRNVDPKTGWWRVGVRPITPFEPLGGAAHILPIYQHHNRVFPCPERMIDSTLALQLPNGCWRPDSDIPMHFLELDALYVFATLSPLVPAHRRDDILACVRRYARVVLDYLKQRQDHYLSLHPHMLMAGVGIMGLFQRLLPDEFTDDVRWTDIFSDHRFYRTHEVEVFELTNRPM